MPTIALTIPQHEETVTRNIIRGIVADIIYTMGFGPKMDIVIEESIGQATIPGSTLDTNPQVKLTNADRCIVNYKETYTEDGILTSAVYRPEYPHFFIDPDIGLDIKPTYGETRVEMDIKLSFRDRSSLSRFKRILRLRGGLNAFVGYHALRYDYGLPRMLLSFLYDVHGLREAVDGYGEDLHTYLNRCFIKGLVSRSTQAGEKHQLAINEQQEDIQGFYGEEIFYNETVSEGSSNTVDFTYRFDYHQILGVVMKYPNIVHNQRVPKKYRTAWGNPPKRNTDPERVLSHMGNSSSSGLARYYLADGGTHLDPSDTWFPSDAYAQTKTIVIAPFVVDTNDPTLVLNINDFTEEQLPVHIKEYMLRYAGHVTSLYATPYLLQGWRVNRVEEDLTMALYPDGTIRTTLPMSVRNRHYIRISLMTDISLLPTNHVWLLLKSPVDVMNIFNNLTDNAVLTSTKEPDVNGKINLKRVGLNKITLLSYHAAVKQLPTTNRVYAMLRETTPKHIQNANVITRSKHDIHQ